MAVQMTHDTNDDEKNLYFSSPEFGKWWIYFTFWNYIWYIDEVKM